MEYAGFPLGTSPLVPEDSDEVIEVTRKKRYKEPFPGYTIFGNGRETRHGGKSLDILDICMKLNTAEMNLMKFFRNAIEDQKVLGEAEFLKVAPSSWKEYDSYLKIALKKNYRHMECLEIIRRVKRGTYMLNPWLFVPPKEVAKHKAEWAALDADCKEKHEANNK